MSLNVNRVGMDTEKTSMRSPSQRESPTQQEVKDKCVLKSIQENANSYNQGTSAYNSRNQSPVEADTVGLICKFPPNQKITSATDVIDDQMSDNTNRHLNSPLSPIGMKQ